MTNDTNVTTKPTIIVHDESPSRLRVWWMNKNLRYSIAMNSFIIILNIAAIFYMKIHKIPLNKGEYVIAILAPFGIIYLFFGLFSCMCWVSAITDKAVCEIAYGCGRFTHNCGLVILLVLLYSISPKLALLVGLFFALPCFLWFLADMIGPCLCIVMKDLRDWWKLVNQPRSVVIVPGDNPIEKSERIQLNV